MIRAAAILALAAAPVAAETRRVQASEVTITAAQDGPAAAIVHYNNANSDGDDEQTFALSLPGLSVGVTAITGHGGAPDSITVEPPEGFIAVPPILEIPDGTSGQVLILPLNAVGM